MNVFHSALFYDAPHPLLAMLCSKVRPEDRDDTLVFIVSPIDAKGFELRVTQGACKPSMATTNLESKVLRGVGGR